MRLSYLLIVVGGLTALLLAVGDVNRWIILAICTPIVGAGYCLLKRRSR